MDGKMLKARPQPIKTQPGQGLSACHDVRQLLEIVTLLAGPAERDR